MVFPSNFQDLLRNCSLAQKKLMLETLVKDIQDTEASSNDKPVVPTVAFDSLVSQHKTFIKDEALLSSLREELDSLNLYSPQSLKPKSMSFSLKDGNYYHDGKNLAKNELDKMPALFKLCQSINRHLGFDKALDYCNVICLSNNKKSIRLHADNEAYVDQSCPIATFTIGTTRKVEFVPFGGNHQHAVLSVEAEHNSLYIMNTGCQSMLQHRVIPGNVKESGDQVRYSISFRKFKPDPPKQCSSTASSAVATTSTTNNTPKIPTSIIVGDSFAARLDANRLSKGCKNVINVAKGGNKIPDAIDSIKKFHENPDNDKLIIDQVFISIGTNDIRHCRGEGVARYKGELFKLTRYIKDVFPGAKIFYQSLIPLPITHENSSYIARNLLQFNRILFEVCKHERVFLFDVFGIFLQGIYRNPRLFSENIRDIHPNKRGLGLLAREYIKRIHCRHFNPLSRD